MAGYTYRELLRKAPRHAVTVAHRWFARHYTRRYFESHPDHPSESRTDAVARVRDADSILFLCWGNVCRSPLAEYYLDARLDGTGIDVVVTSAGLGRSEGRSSPNAAIETAATYGVDLTPHRSQRVSSALVSGSDIVFVMDYNNYYSLVSRFPDAEGKVYFTGALVDSTAASVIPDPYGAGRDRFESVYDQIVAAADTIVNGLAEAN